MHHNFQLFSRPGFSRLNLPWFATDAEIDFILDALVFVSDHGWKFMPQYIFNNETAEWKHHTNQVFKERKWLGNFHFQNGQFKFDHESKKEAMNDRYKDIFDMALNLEKETIKAAAKMHIPDQSLIFGDVSELRWILLPSEVKSKLCSKSGDVELSKSPFHPIKYKIPAKSEIVKEFHLTLDGHKVVKSSWLNFKTNDKPNQEILKENNVIEKEVPEELASIDACILVKRPEEIPKLDIKVKWRPPTKDIFKPFLEGIETFEMIKPGDKVLVCLSGGKDSLTLLHTMKQYQYYTKNAFELGAMTIDPQSSAYDPRPLIPYLAELKVNISQNHFSPRKPIFTPHID